MRNLILTILILLSVAGAALAGDGTLKGKAGDYTVEAAFNPAPPARGPDEISISVKDGSGKNITGATVVVDYFMTGVMSPSQKFVEIPYRMYHAPTLLRGATYKADLDLWIAGGWHIDVRIIEEGRTAKASFYVLVK